MGQNTNRANPDRVGRLKWEIAMLTDLLIGRAAMRSRAIDLHRSAEVACQVESFWRKVQRVFVRDY